MGLKSKCGYLYFTISLISYIHIYLIFIFIFTFIFLLLLFFHLFSFVLLATKHILQFKTYFQLKCISLIKLTSTLNTLFPLEKNFLHWEKDWQCTKSVQKVHKKVHKKFFYCTDIYVCNNFVFLFYFFFGIWWGNPCI